MWRALVVGLGMLVSVPAAPASSKTYSGNFSEIASSDPACDSIFAVIAYQASHFILSVPGPTVVTHFAQPGGFFDDLTFVSNLGYNNDFLYERDVIVGGARYAVSIYGFFDADFIYMEAKVGAFAADGSEMCSASANFTGY